MRSRILRIAAVILCAILASGCATSVSRDRSPYKNHPHVYPSTRLYLRGDSPPIPYENETLTGWNIYPSSRAVLFSYAAVPYLCLVDAPLSVISDTLLLPVDLYRVYDYKRHVRFFEKILCEDGQIPSTERIRAQYVPAYCDGVVRSYLAQSNVNASTEAVQALANAGVAVPVIAGSPGTPTPVLRWLADTDNRGLLTAVAQNPSLPADVVISMTGSGPAFLLSYIVKRDPLPREAQLLLVQHGDASVRKALASNKSVDSEVLYELARNDTNAIVLNTIAAQPNLDERTYMALALRPEEVPPWRLVRNVSVPDAVLSRILDGGDENIAREVLRHNGSSYETKTNALNLIGHKTPYTSIQRATLANNAVIDGVEYLAGTDISLRANGRVSSGTLGADRELNGIRFLRGQKISLLHTGNVNLLRTELPVVINGIPYSKVLNVDDTGNLSEAILGTAIEINGAMLPAGARLGFYESGRIREVRPSQDLVVQGISCAARSTITFYESGKLKRAQMSKDQVIGEVTCHKWSNMQFLESGELAPSSAAEQIRAGAATLHREGKLEEAIEMYTRALEVSPDDVSAFIGRGGAKEAGGDDDAAMLDYSRALEIDPNSDIAHLSLARYWEGRGDFDKVVGHYAAAIRANPRQIRILRSQVASWQLQGEYRALVAYYNYALELNPTDYQAANNLAWILATCPEAKYRNGERAVRLAEENVAKKRSAFSLDTLAAAYAETGDFEAAIKTQKEAIAAEKRTGQTGLLEDFQERLRVYKKGNPWRD